jgi:uncharacterized protein YciW
MTNCSKHTQMTNCSKHTQMAKDCARPRLLVVAAAIGFASLTGKAGDADAAVLSCQKLEQNCEAYVARLAEALTRTRADQVAQPSSPRLSVQRCKQQFAAAEQTGLWPADGPRPALPCTRN